MIKQISAFLENKPGRLADVTRRLGDGGINLLAVSLADTTDFGILRIIAEDPGRACEILRDNDVMVKVTDVAAVRLINRPGALADVLALLTEHDISVEYMYALTCRLNGEEQMVILRLNDQEAALSKLAGHAIELLEPEMVGQNI